MAAANLTGSRQEPRAIQVGRCLQLPPKHQPGEIHTLMQQMAFAFRL